MPPIQPLIGFQNTSRINPKMVVIMATWLNNAGICMIFDSSKPPAKRPAMRLPSDAPTNQIPINWLT